MDRSLQASTPKGQCCGKERKQKDEQSGDAGISDPGSRLKNP
jgi:hypothetical protein